jgi:hypothetical protein
MINEDLRAMMDRDQACRAAGEAIAASHVELLTVERELAEVAGSSTSMRRWTTTLAPEDRAAAQSVRALERRRGELLEVIAHSEQVQRGCVREAEEARLRHHTVAPAPRRAMDAAELQDA